MHSIKVTVRDRIAQAEKKAYICGNGDFVVEFDFDSEWESFSVKTARFKYDDQYIDVVFTGNTCNIPKIYNADTIRVGVFAGNLIVTTPAVIIVSRSILYGHEAPTDHTDNEDAIVAGTITGYKNDRVTSIGDYAFYHCESLTVAVFPSVTSIRSYAFDSCSALTAVDFPLVINIGEGVFSGCTSLTTADFPLVTSIGNNVFSNCESLTEVDFPSANSIDSYAFRGCSALTAVDFPIVTSIGYSAFYNCTSLTSVNLPNATSIDNTAFKGCSALTALILRNSSLCTLSSTNAFTNTPIASGTGYIYVPSALIDSYKAATNWKTYAAKFRALEDYTVDGTTTGALDI